jgi:curved DNA-binding protein
MAVKFRDYYEVLGVDRTVPQDEIQRAYRKLARKYHPDVSKAKDAEEKFKEINEAYEVLKNPEKRKKYDQLGPNWQAGQEFRPPPGWDVHFEHGPGGAGPGEFQWGGTGGFSDFFEMLFGGQRRQDPFRRAGGGPRGGAWVQAGSDHEATIRITVEEAFQGANKTIVLQAQTVTPQGQIAVQEKNYEVKIPPGMLSGQKIRLTGQGGEGMGGGARGDLYLRVEIEPHPLFRIKDRNLLMDLPVAPWEAALGADVELMTLAGPVTLKIPSGSQSGQKLRLRGRGMPNPKGTAGDLLASIQIVVPKQLSPRERELMEKLRDESTFRPRS